MNLDEIAPTIDALLAMEADELGLRMLSLLNREMLQGRTFSLRQIVAANFFSILHVGSGQGWGGAYVGRETAAKAALVEAWTWLEGQALVVPRLFEDSHATHPDARVLSRRGRRLAENPLQALASRLLPKDSLHTLIREDVWALFHRGKYDTAVFEAMKAVEVSVRAASGLSAKELGTHLMRKAFDPGTGPLTDMTAPLGEREARSALFAGAIGSYKNPVSHRQVALEDPNEAAEIIMLASHLLRIVDDRTVETAAS